MLDQPSALFTWAAFCGGEFATQGVSRIIFARELESCYIVSKYLLTRGGFFRLRREKREFARSVGQRSFAWIIRQSCFDVCKTGSGSCRHAKHSSLGPAIEAASPVVYIQVPD